MTNCYFKMYTLLCRAVSDALDLLPGDSKESREARSLLQKALLEAEELYISSPAPDHSP